MLNVDLHNTLVSFSTVDRFALHGLIGRLFEDITDVLVTHNVVMTH